MCKLKEVISDNNLLFGRMETFYSFSDFSGGIHLINAAVQYTELFDENPVMNFILPKNCVHHLRKSSEQSLYG